MGNDSQAPLSNFRFKFGLISVQLKEQLQRAREDVEAHLNRYFELPLNTEKTIKEATHYGVLNGGKRLRPYLVYATGRMMGHTKRP